MFWGCVTKYLSNVLYFSGQSAGQSLGGSLKDSFVDDSSAIAELKADSPVEDWIGSESGSLSYGKFDDSIFDSPHYVNSPHNIYYNMLTQKTKLLYIEDGHAALFIFSEGGIHMNKLTKYKLCGDIDATITGKLLYLILDELADGNGEVVIPQRKISDALHISKGTVSRNLRRLRDGGYINIHSTYHSDGGRAANKYVVK